MKKMLIAYSLQSLPEILGHRLRNLHCSLTTDGFRTGYRTLYISYLYRHHLLKKWVHILSFGQGFAKGNWSMVFFSVKYAAPKHRGSNWIQPWVHCLNTFKWLIFSSWVILQLLINTSISIFQFSYCMNIFGDRPNYLKFIPE